MNKELEQQAREWWRKRHMEYQYSPKREHILPSTDFQMESDLAAFAAHLEAQSKPIQPLVGVLRKLRGAIHAGPDTNTGSRAGHVESLVILGLVDEIDAALSSASEDAG